MLSRLRSWWKKTSKTLRVVIILLLVILLALIVAFIGGYFFNWTWTGFGPYTPPTSGLQRGKTLWDWLQLFFIPAAIAVGVFLLNYTTGRAGRDIASDNQRESALKEYFDKMSELLLHENLRKSDPDAEVRTVAWVLTLIVLPRLDGERKGSVLQFLYESDLINKGKCIVDLSGAGLSGVNTHEADLSGANLSHANLEGANLSGTNLSQADLSRASLFGANLVEANLSGANLSRANLSRANQIGAKLSKADLSHAYLQEASLFTADLSYADLSHAKLLLANLATADLSHAKLSGADLSRANLKDAIGITVEILEKEAISLQGATMPDGSKHA